MLKLIIVCSFLLTFNIYSQKESKKLDSLNIPVSIFTFEMYSNQEFNIQKIDSYLPLTGFKFMITNGVIDNLFLTDLRNIGRDITIDDLNDNYRKAALNNFTVIKNNHFIWNMWDISLQKQYNGIDN